MGQNDKELAILIACDSGIKLDKMHYYMYLMQISGFNLNYRYTIKSNRIRSNGLMSDVNNLVSVGQLDTNYEVLDKGYDNLLTCIMTYYEMCTVETVLYYVERLTIDELRMVCIIDIVIQSTLKEQGYNALLDNQDKVLSTIKYLIGDFSYEDFNTCVGITRKLRGRVK